MNKEILMAVDAVSNEKGVDKEIIFDALEAALASATRKKHGEELDVRVAINRKTGGYDTFRRWKVFADDSKELEVPQRELRMDDAREIDKDVEPGGYVEEPMESVPFGRILAQTAKQVIVQKVREAERAQVVDAYKDRSGTLVSGIVKRVDRNGVYVDLGANAEGYIPREEMIPREPVRSQDRIKAYLKEVRSEPRGPQLFLSRTAPEFLIELFKLEVPEVGQGLINILAAARDAGVRAKIAVRSNDPRVDPVGACVGMRGSRVQAVSNEIAGERVDIIPFDENNAQFVINAMAPAEVTSIVVDEDSHSMDIAVSEDKLSQAIGRGGQNIRLASELTGWELNVMSESQAEAKSESESLALRETFMKQLDVDADVASILVQEGFSTIEEIAYVPASELNAIEEFDEEIVKELRTRARDVLLTQAIASEESVDGAEPAADLIETAGDALARTLARKGVRTREDLADKLLNELGLGDRKNEKVSRYSGGMAQRLMIARALMHEPDVLFLDEPTNNLDPQSRLFLWERIHEMNARGLTILLTTHDMDEADKLCHRIAVMDHGKILQDTTPAELKKLIPGGTVLEVRASGGDKPIIQSALQGIPGAAKVETVDEKSDTDPTASSYRVYGEAVNTLIGPAAQAVLASGAQVRDLSVKQPSLEEVFIFLTGRHLR